MAGKEARIIRIIIIIIIIITIKIILIIIIFMQFSDNPRSCFVRRMTGSLLRRNWIHKSPPYLYLM